MKVCVQWTPFTVKKVLALSEARAFCNIFIYICIFVSITLTVRSSLELTCKYLYACI